jgi:hypothetical protein
LEQQKRVGGWGRKACSKNSFDEEKGEEYVCVDILKGW